MKSKYKAPKVPLLEEWHLEAIKRRIDEGLRIRSINVQTTLKLVERPGESEGKQHLELTSTPFNTIPVIHSQMVIEEFGGWVYKHEHEFATGEKVEAVRFAVDVSARYEGNGKGLFSVSGLVLPEPRDAVSFDNDRYEGQKDGFSRYDIEERD